ncbi:hypothetical protein ABFA07_008011 [Porites harrisoni]
MINTDSNKHGEQVEQQLVEHKRGIREMDSKREKEKKKGKIGQERIIEDESREETFFTDVHAAAMLVAN